MSETPKIWRYLIDIKEANLNRRNALKKTNALLSKNEFLNGFLFNTLLCITKST
jgi:hypothetical protein